MCKFKKLKSFVNAAVGMTPTYKLISQCWAKHNVDSELKIQDLMLNLRSFGAIVVRLTE